MPVMGGDGSEAGDVSSTAMYDSSKSTRRWVSAIVLPSPGMSHITSRTSVSMACTVCRSSVTSETISRNSHNSRNSVTYEVRFLRSLISTVISHSSASLLLVSIYSIQVDNQSAVDIALCCLTDEHFQ